MTNILVLLNLIFLASSSSTIELSQNIDNVSFSDICFVDENNVTNWKEYENYVREEINVVDYEKGKNHGNDGTVSDSIVNIEEYLNEYNSNYKWLRIKGECGLTSDVSNQIPIEMQSAYFPTSDIKKAILTAGVESYTSYGGCGPIASLGIMDYFARYLGYDELISDSTSSDKRVILAAEILSHTNFSSLGGKDNTLVWPWDYCKCFNKVMSNHGLSNIITASGNWTLTGGEKTNYWNKIVKNIDQGLPVTMFTGLTSGNGDFAQHYTNIYGYDTWVGIPNNGGDRVTKTFLKARLNWGRNKEYYYDADILDCGQLGIITYDVNYSNEYSFFSDDFSKTFINSSGVGQYFFNPISTPVLLSNGIALQTTRLRTSYIENEYLVLSPNRKNAGTAYLDITFPNSISKLTFTASMWSDLEGAINENFKIQYFDGDWKDHISINPYNLNALKTNPNFFQVLLPKDTNRIRYYATYINPSVNRNKGRICLDNFIIKYN